MDYADIIDLLADLCSSGRVSVFNPFTQQTINFEHECPIGCACEIVKVMPDVVQCLKAREISREIVNAV